MDPVSVRPSPIAGTWYPDDPATLAALVDRLLDESAAQLPPLPGRVLGLVAPHAGIMYSGPVAGRAFAAVRGQRFDVVAVLGPMHPYHPADILTTAHEYYATPLGTIPVAHDLLEALNARLQQHLGLGLTPIARDPEHSLEMELPFLQRAVGEFRLLPLMLRTVDPQVLHTLGVVLAEILPADSLLVASSDLSHYYPDPVARSLDREMIRRILAMDPLAVLRGEEEGRAFACGRAAIAATLWAAKALGATQAVELGYATSGDTSGDTTMVVGYAAIALLTTNH